MKNYMMELKTKYDMLFDTFRVIDTEEKLAFMIDEQGKVVSFPCHQLCRFRTVGDKCFCDEVANSMEKKTRLEFSEGGSFVIMGYPEKRQEKKYIVELTSKIDGSSLIQRKHSDDLSAILAGMNKMTITDDLTELYNRRFITQRLPRDLSVSKKKNEKVAVVMADIDDFKTVNDNYGHDVGDQVIKEFAELLKTSVRGDDDWVARYGGEEFLIVLRGISYDQITKVILRVKNRIEGHVFSLIPENVRLTCSFGIVICDGYNGHYENMIKEADSCLLEAKYSGKNRAIFKHYLENS